MSPSVMRLATFCRPDISRSSSMASTLIFSLLAATNSQELIQPGGKFFDQFLGFEQRREQASRDSPFMVRRCSNSAAFWRID